MTRRVAARTVAAAACVLVATTAAADAAHGRISRQRWYRSAVVKHGHVVRLAVETRSGDRILRNALVRYGRRTVHIQLHKRVPPGPSTADGRLFCVEVRLSRSVRGRIRVDGSTGRAPDRAPRDSSDGRMREDTRSVDLRHGPCRRLRVRYLR